MSDEYITPTALGAERNCSRSKVNYLRHVCTDYDAQLEARFAKVGVPEAHALVQSRINRSG